MGKANPNRNGEPQSFHSFLLALKGKTVTIYRGGPESKTGKLLDVKSDFITLNAQNNNNKNQNKNENQNQNQGKDNNQNTVVYYQVQHVKSIIEDTKSNSMQVIESDEEEVEYFEAENYNELFEQMIEETIQINQGGPESKYGILVGISGDFLVLYTEDDGIVYINLHHVKSVSIYNKGNDDNENQETIEIPEWVQADSFHDVFSSFSHQWVSINRGGPEAMEGVLVENAGGHYTLVNNQEVMRIHPYHIKSISCGPKGFLKQNQNNKENNENNQETSNETMSDDQIEESSSSSNDNRSGRSSRKRQSSRRRSNREKVVKTVDYYWKG